MEINHTNVTLLWLVEDFFNPVPNVRKLFSEASIMFNTCCNSLLNV